MIKANELRIDNHIEVALTIGYDKSNLKYIEIRVTIDILKDLLEGNKNFVYRPIPLNIEILQKYGFEERQLPDNFNAGRPGYEICIQKSADRWLLLSGACQKIGMICENHDIYKSSCLGFYTYLHELQNLIYIITGQELEIKEFV